MAVDRCYCRDVKFSTIKEIAAREGAGIDRLGETFQHSGIRSLEFT